MKEGLNASLLHVADSQENLVPFQKVEILEKVGLQLGTVFQRIKAQEELKAHMAIIEMLNEHPGARLDLYRYASFAEELIGVYLSVSHVSDRDFMISTHLVKLEGLVKKDAAPCCVQ